MKWWCSTAVFAALAVIGCASPNDPQVERGRALARSPSIADSRYNAFACTTCHAERAADVAGTHRIFPGPPLEGAALRPSWWGGHVVDLGVAVNDCFEHFMQGQRLDAESETAQSLDAYLTDLSRHAPASTTVAVAFTVQSPVRELQLGNAMRGEGLYERACATCHGALHARGQQLAHATVIPDDTIMSHCAMHGPQATREIFVEKIRHGSFLGLEGTMPPFSVEVLSDADVSDILAYVGAPSDTSTCTPSR